MKWMCNWCNNLNEKQSEVKVYTPVSVWFAYICPKCGMYNDVRYVKVVEE